MSDSRSPMGTSWTTRTATALDPAAFSRPQSLTQISRPQRAGMSAGAAGKVPVLQHLLHSQQMRIQQLAALAVMALPAPVFSNDTMMTLAAGGLVPVKSAAVVMESEDLEISIGQVTVKYVFRNRTKSDIDAIVGFPLPALLGPDVEHIPVSLPSKDPVNFVDFKVFAGGKAIPVRMESRALNSGRDITDRLLSLGIPVSVANQNLNSLLLKLPAAKRSPLEKEELIVCEDVGGGERRCWPTWETRTRFYWMQHFPAESTVAVQHTYRPVVGGSYLVASSDPSENIKPYCGGADDLARISQVKKAHPAKSQDDIVLWENRIQYILTTANNWSGPIGNFHLTILADTPEDVVMTCMQGLKRTSPTRHEMVRADFRPDKELNVLILTASKRTRQ